MGQESRTLKRVITGKSATDGAGVKLTRLFGYYDVKEFDPFLMMDAFDSVNSEDYIKGFPWHPHRGIETITYLIQGEIEHGDSLGNKGVIQAGECQWMTAGSGIIHQEMPQPSDRLLGCQLWLNLPEQHKMTEPKYHSLTQENIPLLQEDGVSIRILSGNYKGKEGAMNADYVKALYLDIAMEANQKWHLETLKEDNLFVYVLEGNANFGSDPGEPLHDKQIGLFTKGSRLEVETPNQPIRFLLMAGKPLEEPIAWGGPIVMNTHEELEVASRELENGTFIKSGGTFK